MTQELLARVTTTTTTNYKLYCQNNSNYNSYSSRVTSTTVTTNSVEYSIPRVEYSIPPTDSLPFEKSNNVSDNRTVTYYCGRYDRVR